MDELDCSGLWGNHSDDRVTVWHGTTTPAHMCGRHGHNMTADDWRKVLNP